MNNFKKLIEEGDAKFPMRRYEADMADLRSSLDTLCQQCQELKDFLEGKGYPDPRDLDGKCRRMASTFKTLHNACEGVVDILERDRT